MKSSSPETRMEDLLLSFRRRIFEACRKDTVQYDLTVPQIEIIRFVIESKLPVPMKMVADHLKITPPSATAIVDELVRKGLIKRIPSPIDRRVICIALTPKAAKFHETMKARKQTIFHEMISRLSQSDRKSLERIITILIQE